mmetsp:Transcript_22382/g.51567  ORF Transcript_22382/g.51567 Transcript_22382/m.51567 type:complete len:391 (-) Transcript_22382:781-1953(-)
MTTMTETLSSVPRSIASKMRRFAMRSGDCAVFLRQCSRRSSGITSHRPSEATRRTLSSAQSSTTRISGSAISPSLRSGWSPMQRVTWMTPPTRNLPSAVALTAPPACMIRARSAPSDAMCSRLSASTPSPRHSLHWQSPAFATSRVLLTSNAARAVHPLTSCGCSARKRRLSATKEVLKAALAASESGRAAGQAERSSTPSCSAQKLAAASPLCPSNTAASVTPPLACSTWRSSMRSAPRLPAVLSAATRGGVPPETLSILASRAAARPPSPAQAPGTAGRSCMPPMAAAASQGVPADCAAIGTVLSDELVDALEVSPAASAWGAPSGIEVQTCCNKRFASAALGRVEASSAQPRATRSQRRPSGGGSGELGVSGRRCAEVIAAVSESWL